MDLNWTKNKPIAPGAYWVRGYHVGHRDDIALVEVREVDGELCSNLHNSNSDPRDPMPLADHSDRFEWCDAFMPANARIEPGRCE